jgi:hypothetical protein
MDWSMTQGCLQALSSNPTPTKKVTTTTKKTKKKKNKFW